MDNIELHIEALIFASEQAITIEDIKQVIESLDVNPVDQSAVQKSLENIADKYSNDAFAIGLYLINGGYQFLTKKEYHPTVQQLQVQKSKKKLSQAALETLAIIAYKQPITKLEIEQIRGVNCDYTIQRLLEKELIAIAGKADSVGKPILYATSNIFMDYFGINSMQELPQLKDMHSEENQIGENNS